MTPPSPAATFEQTNGHAPVALPSLLRHWAEHTPDAPCLLYTDLEGAERRWSYADFATSAARAAGGLAALGIGPGDRCVLHNGNTEHFLPLLFGLWEIGAVAVPTIAQYSAQELAYVVADSEARLLIASAELAAVAAPAAAQHGCPLALEHDIDGGELRAEPGEHTEGVALVLYTSGTTSRPKGVMLGQQGLLYTARTFAEHFRLQPADTTLTCLPLFHINGLALQMLPAIASGGRLVLTPRFSASRFWGWVTEHGVTAAHLVAGPVRLLLGAEPAPSDGAHRLRLMSFGMPLDDAEIEEFETRFGVPLLMVWGSTETGCGGTLMPLDVGHRPGWQNIGPAMRGWDVAVVDPEGTSHTALRDGERGELVVRSPGTMLGYLGQPDATAVALRDGWVHTGDLGWRDDDGYFHFVDRLKDMLKPSGENVAAGEVERVVLEHPGVARCAVVGVPDRVRMEAVVAVVVPRPGAKPRAEEIQAWCGERLAAFKVPSRVEFRDELPETSIGKVRKPELVKSLLEGSPGR